MGSTIMSQFMLPYNQVLKMYVSDPSESEVVQEFEEELQHYEHFGVKETRLRFWNKLLAYEVAKEADIGEGPEAIFEILAWNGLVTLDSELAKYHRTNWSFHYDIAEDPEREPHPLSLNYDETEIERRAKLVQEGLDAIQRIGLEIINRGNVPLIRMLVLNPEERQRFLAKHQGAADFESKDVGISFQGYTISDIAKHVDIKLKASPFDSWSYAAPSGKNLYRYPSLGFGNDLILISEKPRSELLWARELPAASPSKLYLDQWKFYKNHSLHASAISNNYLLTRLDEEGFSGIITPEGEREATMWGRLPIRGIIEMNLDK